MTKLGRHRGPSRATLLSIVTVALAAAVLLLLYAATLAPSITWWHGGADSGDLASAAATFGVPHPTGYPLFVLLGRLATLLPWGETAGRINAMNALLATLGAALTGWCVLLLVRGAAPLPAALAGAGATVLVLGLAPLYWSQAIITEVYALQAALTALVLLVRLWPAGRPVLLGAACGLALTNHLTSLLLIAAIGAGIPRRPVAPLRTAGWFGLGLIGPLLLYLLLPLRAAAAPAANWGDPDSLGRLLAHVTGRQYRGYFDPLDLAETVRALVRLTGLLARELPVFAVPAAIGGSWWLARRRPAVLRVLLVIGGGSLLFASAYRSADRQVYLLPAEITVALLMGVGLAALLAWAAAKVRPRALLPAGAAALLLFGSGVAPVFHSLNLHGDRSAERFARVTLEALPPGATYYTARDDVTFTLWYAQRVHGLRPDVRVVDVRNPSLRGLP